MSTQPFDFATAGRILFGAGRAGGLPALLAGYHGRPGRGPRPHGVS